MKKILLYLVVLLFVIGCSSETKKTIKKNNTNKTIEEKTEVKYQDENNMPIAFYRNNEILKEYKTNITSGVDIGLFTIYPSNEDTISYNGNYGENFYSTWIKYDPLHKTKIGYNLKYTLKDGTNISHNILSINDTPKYEGYILTFLYDDYLNRNSRWYSHIEEKDFNDNTFLTSIKLYPQSSVDDINSKIILTVFTYDTEDDFDENTNEYRGKSKYSITICDVNKTC